MEFKKFTAGSLSYGTDNQPPKDSQLPNVCFQDPKFEEILTGNDK
jgi:hypothetical protein